MGLIFSSVFSWLFRTVLIKFVLFSGLFVVVTSMIGYLTTKLSYFSPDILTNSLSTFTPAMWYFIDLTMFSVGFPMVVSASLVRFAIRRIPFLG